MSLRLGINLLWLVPGVVGGTEEAAVGFLRELLDETTPGLEVTLFALEAFEEAHPDLCALADVDLLKLDGRSRAARVAAESTWLAKAARAKRIDLMHNYGGATPLVSLAPSVLTVHDVQVFDHPENFSPVKRRWLRTMLPRSVRSADGVITPSEFARRSLLTYIGVDEKKVRVAPHGVALRRRVAPTHDEIARVRATYRVGDSLVVYPAVTYPHKNHSMLIEAFAQVARKNRDVTLVLPGGIGFSEADVRADIERLGVGDRVRRVGRVPGRDLAVLMHLATVMAFPSRYEGFGLPLLEAMAEGTPVVGADTTAIPEVLGGAGVLLDPDDVQGWSAAIEAILEDDGARRDLAARGHDRVGEFAWRKVVEQVVAYYHEVWDESRDVKEGTS